MPVSYISFNLCKTTNGQMATDMFIVRQNTMRLIPTIPILQRALKHCTQWEKNQNLKYISVF